MSRYSKSIEIAIYTEGFWIFAYSLAFYSLLMGMLMIKWVDSKQYPYFISIQDANIAFKPNWL